MSMVMMVTGVLTVAVVVMMAVDGHDGEGGVTVVLTGGGC